MMRLTMAAAFLAISAGLAVAGPCEDDVRKIDAALKKADLTRDQKAQVQDMKKQAQKLCAAGNTDAGLDVTAEAKAMLNIE